MIKIRAPIWKTQSIGIAEKKLKDGDNEIQILYQTKDGSRLYPGTYIITKTKALTYTVQTVKYGVRLRVIPIRDLIRKNQKVAAEELTEPVGDPEEILNRLYRK